MKTVSNKSFTTLCTWIRGWDLYRGGFYAVQNSANKRSHMRMARQGQGGADSLVSRAGHVLARYKKQKLLRLLKGGAILSQGSVLMNNLYI